METITRDDAKQLAVCYHAYLSCDADQHASVSVWGNLLLQIQEKVGIDLADPDNLRARIEYADRKFAEKSAAERAVAYTEAIAKEEAGS